MGSLKFSTGLFLEKAELNRFKEFVQDEGYVKYFQQNSLTFGLIDNEGSSLFENGKITEGSSLEINHNEIRAFDSNGKFIYKPATNAITVPNDDVWYWVKISYAIANEEIGTFSIDINGNLTCSTSNGTLTQVLRGQPNFPSRVKLIDSTNNLLEYDVLEVVDDNNAVLQGNFVAETDLKLVVVGTFAPGSVPTSTEKDIFNYDSCNLEFVAETTVNTPPTFTTGEDFFLARVKNDGTILEIEDKRVDYKYKSVDNGLLTNFNKAINPVIGVESIKYDVNLGPRFNNIVHASWGLRSSNWSFNSKLNRITFNAAQGGRYKANDVTLFSNGDLDGWRIYNEAGEYVNVKNSSKSGSQLNFDLDAANPDDFSDTTQQLLVVPNADEIELIFKSNPDDNVELPDVVVNYPINRDVVKVPLSVYKATGTSYVFTYRYKQFLEYSPSFLPQDDAIGFYNEGQFDDNGVFIASPSQTPYTSSDTVGFIPLSMATASYFNTIGSLITGDLFGVSTTQLNNAFPTKNLVVGSSKQYQIIEGTITLGTNHYINLSTIDAQEGNVFWIHFKFNLTRDGNNLFIVQDFVSSGSPGTILREFTNRDEDYISPDHGLWLRAIFDDEGNWRLTGFLEKTAGFTGLVPESDINDQGDNTNLTFYS